MKRRILLSGLLLGLALAQPASAMDVVDSVISQLQDQGFVQIGQTRTLLGRVRIVAARADGVREIIINPNTGEILRDLWTPRSGKAPSIQIIEEEGSENGERPDDDDSSGADDDEDSGEDDGGEDDGGDDDGGGDDDNDGGEDDDDDDSGEDSGGNSGGNSGGGGGNDDDDDDD